MSRSETSGSAALCPLVTVGEGLKLTVFQAPAVAAGAAAAASAAVAGMTSRAIQLPPLPCGPHAESCQAAAEAAVEEAGAAAVDAVEEEVAAGDKLVAVHC